MLNSFCTSVDLALYHSRGWSRADLRLVYQFWGHLIWAPKFNKVRKKKTNFLHKNEKLPCATLFSKLNIESEHINIANRTKKLSEYSNCLCFHQCLDKKVGTGCPELPTILKILPLIANHGGTWGWPSTWHNSTNAQIRALDQPLHSLNKLFHIPQVSLHVSLFYLLICEYLKYFHIYKFHSRNVG